MHGSGLCMYKHNYKYENIITENTRESDTMALCPLIEKECILEECQWYAPPIRSCVLHNLSMIYDALNRKEE
jgi:hypothetical protein